MVNIKSAKQTQQRKSNTEQRRGPHWTVYILIGAGVFALGAAAGIAWHAHRQSPVVAAVADKVIVSPCEQIEKILLSELPDANDGDVWAHTYRANSFAILAKKGCPNNQASFQDAALGEVDVARALVAARSASRPEYQPEREVEGINRVYFQLDMKDMARAFSDEINRAATAVSDFVDAMKNFRVQVTVNE
ncbi:hypothetical protein FACS189421_14520 [Bacteroidia bacterium]|nr:hypothetical protein FACS189421_14520 [Bacteroidia bacterium]